MMPIMHMELVPTEYAIRMRPVFIASLLVLVLIVVGKFVIRDFWGAVSLMLVIIMGLFVLSGHYSINASSALFYTVVALISGIFDSISCALYFQHSIYHMFDPK